ncbi:hypothetical protein [Qaidamihabitans albus]|uniref:hypothetical protein n=1 Tax=Qaidamihabitans albus TaxID=2795733 RepID=UPI0018F19D79|nr:hypothetical protein [Qaidamihabitans albus]
MGWFRKSPEGPFGYEDRAALKGFGGFEPADPADATPGYVQPAPPPAPEPRRPEARERPARGRPRTVPVGVIATMVFAIGVFALSFGLGSDPSKEARSAPSTARTAAPSTPSPRIEVPAVIDGWSPVPGRDGTYAYDVSPSWEPRPTTIHGWQDGPDNPGITLVTSAFIGQGYCAADDDRDRGGSGLASADQPDPVLAARETATLVARQAYTPDGGAAPGLAVGAPRAVTVPFRDGGERAAALTLVEVTVRAGADPCLPDRALVGALAVGSGTASGGSAVLVAYADQGVPGAPAREELERLLRSFRSVPEADRATVTPTG